MTVNEHERIIRRYGNPHAVCPACGHVRWYHRSPVAWNYSPVGAPCACFHLADDGSYCGCRDALVSVQ